MSNYKRKYKVYTGPLSFVKSEGLILSHNRDEAARVARMKITPFLKTWKILELQSLNPDEFVFNWNNIKINTLYIKNYLGKWCDVSDFGDIDFRQSL